MSALTWCKLLPWRGWRTYLLSRLRWRMDRTGSFRLQRSKIDQPVKFWSWTWGPDRKRRREKIHTQETLNIVCEVFNLQLRRSCEVVPYRRLRSSPICSLRGPVTINRCAAGDNADALVGSKQSLIRDIYSSLKESLCPRETLQKERELNGRDWWYVCWRWESKPWGWCGDLWLSLS